MRPSSCERRWEGRGRAALALPWKRERKRHQEESSLHCGEDQDGLGLGRKGKLPEGTEHHRDLRDMSVKENKGPRPEGETRPKEGLRRIPAPPRSRARRPLPAPLSRVVGGSGPLVLRPTGRC